MLYWLTLFSDGGDFFNLFRYITFRAGGAFFTALIFGFLFGQPLINLLKRRQKNGQPIRDDGPQSHIEGKAGTPTMGGVLILGAVVTSSLLWARLDIGYVWMVLFVTIADSELEKLVDAPPEDLGHLARSVTAGELAHQRAIVLQRLRALGVDVIEAPWDRIGYQLIDKYFAIKQQEAIG